MNAGHVIRNEPINVLQQTRLTEMTVAMLMKAKWRLPGSVEDVLLFVLLRVQQDDDTPADEG